MRCDIVMPIWNQLELTKDCIDSIMKYTHFDYRLIAIDNGSGVEVRSYLNDLQNSRQIPFVLIRNEENLGFVKATNQGIKASEAPYICSLNNDTLVQDGWLSEMVATAESDGGIGIVNPSSNNLGQRPPKGESIKEYAERLKSQRGKFVELGSALGFCMLMKKGLTDRIGLFDEIYGMGNFEDTDFSRRAVEAGFRCVRSCGAYVYHRESSSFKMVKTFDEEFSKNRRIYESRWGKPRRILYAVSSNNAERLKRIKDESLELARGGHWVHIYARESVDLHGMPAHSNIIIKTFPDLLFPFRIWLKVLTKKKRFDEIRR